MIKESNEAMATPTTQLSKVRVAGFRSLRDVTVELGPLTVLIGPNGAGKSNLLSVLSLMQRMQGQNLQYPIGQAGGASRVLHYGPKTTRELEISLEVTEHPSRWGYIARLGYAAGDTFVFAKERLSAVSGANWPSEFDMGSGHAESRLSKVLQTPHSMVKVAYFVAGMRFFHFHDTSFQSPLRQNARQADSKYVRSDGSNLAAYLYRLARSESDEARAAWTLLEGLIRRVAPFIKTLSPELVNPERGDASAVRLYWYDERGYRFDVFELSDGTLRALALFAALTQPPSTRPTFIMLDEPELGLHPAAISIFAALVRSASTHTQILIATQSPVLLDEFAPDEVLVAERRSGETIFSRLDREGLAAWLEDYSLSQLYDKNLLGGRP